MTAVMALLTAVGVLAGTAAVLVVLVLVARRMRRRGSAGAAIGAAMAAYDEAMHPLAHDAVLEQRVQEERAGTVAAPVDR